MVFLANARNAALGSMVSKPHGPTPACFPPRISPARCSGTGSENWLIFYKSKLRRLSLITLDPKINLVIGFFIMSALSNLPPIGATACTINTALARYLPGRLLPSLERDIFIVDQTDVGGRILGCGRGRHP